MRTLLLIALVCLFSPLIGYAQLTQAVPVDSATARVLLAQAARQYPKFAAALDDVRQHDPLLRRFVVVTSAGPLGSPAAAFPNGVVRLDRRFLEHPQPEFDDNRLVVVLYHEIGHLHYFSTVPASQRDSQASERAAFDYSLLKTKALAEAGDCAPLQTGLKFMLLRSRSNDLADPHVRALKSLVQEPAYAEYKAYVASQCGVKP
ncbi:hypothetical protein GCM10023172_24000 [Hymenobacter ginsengisoli]|uniref:Peptidase M48 domain-containing protein n=1 Tax=Hymenobacter ginsengisoli TaxID=1051626 RepID=A0ABP8QEC6_9BACT|nr:MULTISPECIES: hypothetical protein [unclassified Hymenobacter]MBO2033206.1 hypothetical protein [Hymenobacter sp. BT559]